MVIVSALGKRQREAVESEYQAIADRIEALIEQGKLQCQGDPKFWRYSEVRRAEDGDAPAPPLNRLPRLQ